MSALLDTLVAVVGGLLIVSAGLAWALFLPAVGLMWILGWLA